MCWTMNFISIILISLSIAINCMDKPTVWDKCSQHYVTLHLSDGNDFQIKTWKILESVALYSDYLRREKSAFPVKNMSLLYSTVTLPEMELYSDLCEVKVKQEKCDAHFKHLNAQQQRALITVCGEYDEHHNKKLLCPGLIERLFHAYCKVSFLTKSSMEPLINQNIKPHIWNAILRGCVATQVVKAKLPHHFTSPRVCTEVLKYTDGGGVKKVPSILMKGSCDIPNSYVQKSYHNIKYFLYRAKILDEDTAYHLTSKDNVVKIFQDSLLLWFVNTAENTYKSTEIKHADEIIDARFSNDARHFFIRSAKKVQLFKLMHHDGTPIARKLMVFDTAENSFTNDFNFSFNKQGTLFLTSYVDGVTQKNVCTLWDITGEDCIVKEEKRAKTFNYAKWSDNGCRIITVSYPMEGDSTTMITLWNISDTSNISLMRRYEDIQDGPLFATPSVVCIKWSPEGKRWIMVYNNAIIFFFDENNDSGDVVQRRLPARTVITAVSVEPKDKVRVQYSQDGYFVAICYRGIPSDMNTVALYSAVTHECLGVIGRFVDGLGITPDNQLVMISKYTDSPSCTTISLENNNDLAYLESKVPLCALVLLQRLYNAFEKKERITLYKEGLAYRMLRALPGLHEIVERYFPVIDVIDNNKKIGETCGNIVTVGKVKWDKSINGLNQWWQKR